MVFPIPPSQEDLNFLLENISISSATDNDANRTNDIIENLITWYKFYERELISPPLIKGTTQQISTVMLSEMRNLSTLSLNDILKKAAMDLSIRAAKEGENRELLEGELKGILQYIDKNITSGKMSMNPQGPFMAEIRTMLNHWRTNLQMLENSARAVAASNYERDQAKENLKTALAQILSLEEQNKHLQRIIERQKITSVQNSF